jgi:hypothetical protein
MKTASKIERKGYKLTYNIGYKDGTQCIVSVSAMNSNGRVIATERNVTALYKIVKDHFKK